MNHLTKYERPIVNRKDAHVNEPGFYDLRRQVRIAYDKWLLRRGLRDTIEERMALHRNR